MRTVTLFGRMLLALTVAGCAPQMTPEQQNALNLRANRPVTCNAGPDCERKWSRAVQWVTRNSTYKIQTQSENLIQTYTPINSDTHSGFTITKFADTGNVYVIDFLSGCDNWIGCVPSGLELKAGFADFVLDSPLTPRANQDKLPPASPAIQRVLQAVQSSGNECKEKRQRGELKTYVDSAKCSNPKIVEAGRQKHLSAHEMSIIDRLSAKRLDIAKQLDDGQITMPQADVEQADFIAHADQ